MYKYSLHRNVFTCTLRNKEKDMWFHHDFLVRHQSYACPVRTFILQLNDLEEKINRIKE